MELRIRTRFVAAACALTSVLCSLDTIAFAYSSRIDDNNTAALLSAQADESLREKGVRAMNCDSMEQALDDLDQAILLNPKNYRAYYDRGKAFAHINDMDRALSDLSKAIQLSPDFGAARLERGKAYLKQSQLSQALTDFSMAAKDPKSQAQALYNRGICYGALREGEKAVSDLCASIKLMESDKSGKDYKNAVSALSAQCHFNGKLEALSGNFERAIAQYDRAIDLNSKCSGAFMDKAMAEDSLDRESDALRDVSTAISISPLVADAHTERCNILFKMKDFVAGEKECAMAIRIDPNNPDAHYARGRCLQALGLKSPALKEFSVAKTLYTAVENEPGQRAASSRMDEVDNAIAVFVNHD